MGKQSKLCNELVSTGDIDRDGNTGVVRLGTGHRGHSALSKPLWLERTIDGGLSVRRRRGWRGGTDKGTRLLHGGNGALGGLRGGLVGMRRSSRSSVRQRASGWRVRVEDKLLDSHDLLSIAELLELAQEGLNLVYECLAFGSL